ncbi:creatininase family protein [Candidatus Bathyarchaeota archaeon]|nr:creatininase family protein [Candidatus Bathyarchaeota archaeon]
MVQLAEISWTDAEELFKRTDVVLIPVGSTEQHGPHNPLGTDHLVAGALARVVGERTGVAALPTIPVGVSEHHRHFPGTLWVPPAAFREYVKAVALSAASHGAKKIIFVNGHGGNTASLLEVAGELRRNHKVFSAVIMAFPPGMAGHAGAGETSVNLYFHRELVRMDRAVDTRQKEGLGPLKMEGLGRVGPAQFPWDTIDLSETGVLGAAGEVIASTKASEEEGRRLMEPYIEEVCRFIEELKVAKVEELVSKPWEVEGFK